MYLVPIHVPIYLDGERQFVTTEWRRSLELLRDSFAGRFGQIAVAAPSLPASHLSVEQTLEEVPGSTEGFEFFPSFDLRCRARQFWLRDRARWQGELAVLSQRADVVHGGLDDVYRPIAFEGFRVAVRLEKPTLFVQDSDVVTQQQQLVAHQGPKERAKASAYNWIYERMCRWSVARADLSLLKGSALISRYGSYAQNAKEFHDTSFSVADIVGKHEMERRLATLSDQRPLRLVYCGRLTTRKGVDRSLHIIARATALGVSVEFDIIGDGAERQALESFADSAGIGQRVRFLGSLRYDRALLQRLAGYDGLMFTPTAEDTPRMIFDGYAAGLPIVAFNIGYVQERYEQEHATFLMPRNQIEESAVALVRLCRNPGQLAELSRYARAAAEHHCAERWYQRRAEWTIEAVERHNRAIGTATTGRAA